MKTPRSQYLAPGKLWAIINYFIPSGLWRFDHREQLYKARALVVTNLATLILLLNFCTELAAHLQVPEVRVVALPVLLLTILLTITNLLVFRRRGSLVLAANGYALINAIAIMITVSISGGFYLSHAMPWWPIVIVYTFIFGGWLTALLWSLLTLLVFLIGIRFEALWVISIYSDEALRRSYIYSILFCGFYLLAALWFLDFCHRQLLRRVQVERDRALFSAAHDPLTGLANRKAFQQQISQMAERQKLVGGLEALLMIDLDGFKQINDELGHKAGDQVLIAIAQRLRHRIRRSDCAARLGGDEFAVLLCDLPEGEHIETLAGELHEAITSPITLEDGREVRVGASIGIALDPDDGDEMETLLHHADLAMYRAKTGGLDFLFYSELISTPGNAR